MLSSLGHWVSCCWGYGRRSNGEAELLTAQDIGKHSYGEFSMASIQANQQNEDSFHIESCPPFGGLFVGIFDGHGGHEASQFIRNHLFSHLTKFVSLMGGVSETSIGMAFDNTEREFEARVAASWSTNPHLATVGSCALVGVISDGRLYVSNLGDSRAVLGRLCKTSGACTSLQLSIEHNVAIEAIREELKFLHPDDSNIVSLRHGVWRVRGIIQVSRSIGDMYLKKQEFNQEPLYAKFRLSEPLTRPLLTSKPTILVHELQPDDNFVIFASDGLWDHLTNDEAVDLVSRHPHKGVARKLINLALQKAAQKREVRYEDLQKIKKGIRRHFHDDITVVVVFLNQEFIKRSSKIGRVLHVNMMDSHSTASVHAHQDCNVKWSSFSKKWLASS